jgi:hypothetical protein
MGDDQAVDTGIAAGCDHRQRFRRRQMAGLYDEFLLGADSKHVANRGQHLAVGAEHFDAFGRIP